MAAKLYDNSAGAWVNVPDSDVTDAVAQGSHSFEDGIPIPVISPKGEYGTIQSGDVQQSFKDGFRFANHEDVLAWQKRGVDASNARIFGGGFTPEDLAADETGKLPDAAFQNNLQSSGTQAFVQSGMSKYTFGATDKLEQAMAQKLGMQPSEFAAANQQLIDQNPGNTAMGGVAGSMLNPVGRAIGKGIAAPLGIAGETAATLFGGTEGLIGKGITLGAKGMQYAVPEAVMGAFFGANQAASEASLGDPADLAEKIAAGGASGFGFGAKFGGFTGAFSAASPSIKGLFGDAGGKLGRGLNSVAESAANAVMRPALTLTGNRDKVPLWDALMASPEARAYEARNGADALDVLKQNYLNDREAFQKQSADTLADLQKQMKGEARSLQDNVNNTVQAHGGDLGASIESLYKDEQLVHDSLNTMMAEDGAGPGSIGYASSKATHNVADQLIANGKPADVELGKAMKRYMTAQETPFGIGVEAPFTIDRAAMRSGKSTPSLDPAAEYHGKMSAANEVDSALELRKMAQDALDGKSKLSDQGRIRLQNYIDSQTKALYKHEQFGRHIEVADGLKSARDEITDLIDSKVEPGKLTDPKNKVLWRLTTDPAFRDKFSQMAGSIGEIVPQLKSFVDAGENVALQRESVAKINDLIQAMPGKGASVDDVEQLAEALIKGRNIAGTEGIDYATRLQNLKQRLDISKVAGEGSNVPPAAQWGAILKGMDKTPSATLGELAPHEDLIRSLNKLRGPVDKTELKYALLKSAAKILGPSLVGGLAGGMLGDGPLGWAGGAALGAAGAAMHFAGDPGKGMVSSLDNLTKLQRVTTSVEPMVNRFMDAAVDGLTGVKSTTLRNAVMARAAQIPDTPEPVKRDTFAAQYEHIQDLAKNPQALHDHAMEKIGVIPDAPQITQALLTNYAMRVQQVAQQFPQDPLAGQYINAKHSPWTPSDMDLSRLNRYVAVMGNPLQGLKNIANGTAAPEEVQALQQGWPLLYSQLQQRVSDAIMKPDTHLSYQQRVQVGRTLGLTADPSMSPSMITAFQGRLAAGGGGANKTPGSGASNPMSARTPDNDPNSTPTERLTYK